MKPLFAVNSSLSNTPNELVLVNASKIGQLYELPLPLVISKVNIRLEVDSEWSLFVEENGSKTPLINDEDVKALGSKVDLLEVLGHALILFKHQKLCFYSSYELAGAVCFIDVSSEAFKDSIA